MQQSMQMEPVEPIFDLYSAQIDVELHGQCMHTGDKVALAYGAANRDERKFPNPDVYDIKRNPREHLGFGEGPHFCLGTRIARLVTAVAMRTFLDAIPSFECTQSHLDWVPSLPLRVLA